MKRVLQILTLIISTFAFGQQLHQSSMYMMNNYLLNPAEGGTEDFIDIQAGYRTQWVGLGGSNSVGPKTFYLSGHSPIGKHSTNKDTSSMYNASELLATIKPTGYHGVGGMVLSDNAGHFNVLSLKASYAYHYPLTRDFYISLGGFVGIKNYTVDTDALDFDSQGGADAVQGGELFNSVTEPDLTLGIWGYHKKFYFGISTFQLLGNTFEIVENANSESPAALDRHYYITGGYKYDINPKLFVVPSLLVKILPGVPVTWDLNAKITYNTHYWGGVSYRMGNVAESVVLLGGITLNSIFDIGYAYDIILSDINNVSSGSHEIMAGIRLPSHQHHKPPKQFW